MSFFVSLSICGPAVPEGTGLTLANEYSSLSASSSFFLEGGLGLGDVGGSDDSLIRIHIANIQFHQSSRFVLLY